MTFKATGISEQLLLNLEAERLYTPTPIQEQAIPPILAGSNLIGVAHTGTGKTFAFALPLIDRLTAGEGSALILVPTRELALQLDKSIRRICKGFLKMKPSVLVSGVPLKDQAASLKAGPRIIIATPGRLQEHLDTKTLNLQHISAVVLDEADRMLDSGFAPQIERIIDRTPKGRQTLMFSATMSSSVTKLIERYAPDAVRVIIPTEFSDVSLVTQNKCLIGRTRRLALMTRILHNTHGKIIVFVANKRTAQRLYVALKETKLSVAGLHGDRTPAGREEAMSGFRKEEYQVLITTDVSSRGIDVPRIALVLNYDVPLSHETYLHRIGRTGRAGKTGKAITFVTPEQSKLMQRIEAELGSEIPVLPKGE
jgi:ATP-dependent RNA helicase RhlE